MKKQFSTQSATFSGEKPLQFSGECCLKLNHGCILDLDYFVKTLSDVKAKGVRPDLIGSIITHYASKWLPELTGEDQFDKGLTLINFEESPESATASWMKKKFLVETLVGILPPEKDSIPCNFLLRLLRIASTVVAEPMHRTELERRVSWQLDQASLKEMMIPSFSHTCGTLLDVELMLRLVRRFVNLDEGVKSGAALIKVAKLVDGYLAEAAVDSNLSSSQFVALADALPSHARATDDGLYRAVDTYLKAHPGVSKQERKTLSRLIDSRKLSSEASIHAAQNERLPVRAVIQVLLSEQTKLNKQQHIMDWSGSFNGGTRSPNTPVSGFDQPARCLSISKREMAVQQLEIKKLREEVLRLQSQCVMMQGQIERLVEKKRGGFFSWRRMGMSSSMNKSVNVVVGRIEETEKSHELGLGQLTPTVMKTKQLSRTSRTHNKLRKSMS